MLAPSGYSRGRDPLEQPLGMALVKHRQRRHHCSRADDLDEDDGKSSTCCGTDEEEHHWVGDRSPEQVKYVILAHPKIIQAFMKQ